MCVGCTIEFSGSENGSGDEGDWESEDGSVGSILDGEDYMSMSGDSEGGDINGEAEALAAEMRDLGGNLRAARGRARRLRERVEERGLPELGAEERPVQPRHRERDHEDRLRNMLDVMAEHDSDGLGGEHDYPDVDESDFEGFSNSEEDDYGGSFIDDGELSGGEGGDGEEGKSDGEGGDDEMEVDANVVHNAGSDEDDPPIEELRRRRVERHGAARAM